MSVTLPSLIFTPTCAQTHVLCSTHSVLVCCGKCILGQVTTRDDLDYDKTWTDLLTIFEDHNKSRHHMGTGVMHAGVFNVDATADVLFNETDEDFFCCLGEFARAVGRRCVGG